MPILDMISMLAPQINNVSKVLQHPGFQISSTNSVISLTKLVKKPKKVNPKQKNQKTNPTTTQQPYKYQLPTFNIIPPIPGLQITLDNFNIPRIYKFHNWNEWLKFKNNLVASATNTGSTIGALAGISLGMPTATIPGSIVAGIAAPALGTITAALSASFAATLTTFTALTGLGSLSFPAVSLGSNLLSPLNSFSSFNSLASWSLPSISPSLLPSLSSFIPTGLVGIALPALAAYLVSFATTWILTTVPSFIASFITASLSTTIAITGLLTFIGKSIGHYLYLDLQPDKIGKTKKKKVKLTYNPRPLQATSIPKALFL